MRRHLSYANVVATLALVFALGLGGAWAADQLAKNSVSSKQVKNGSLKSKDLKDGKAVTGADVKDDSIGGADLAPIEVTRPQLGNGGQNDCLWIDLSAAEPAITPVSYRRNGYGEVSLSGIAQAADGPGGDGDCSGSGADAISDSTIFVLDPSDTPAKSGIYMLPSGAAAVFVVGGNGLVSGTTQYSPGAVLSAVSAVVQLDGISFLAADAAGPTPAAGPDRISPRKLRTLLDPQGLPR